MLRQPHIQRPLLTRFPAGREPQKRCTSRTTGTIGTTRQANIHSVVVYSNVNFSWKCAPDSRLEFDFLCARRWLVKCAANELPAISFRVLIFNHTTTQIQKTPDCNFRHQKSARRSWQDAALGEDERQCTIGSLLSDELESSPAPSSM